MRVLTAAAVYVGQQTRARSTLFRSIALGSTATWSVGLLGFVLMGTSDTTGTLVLLSSPLVGGTVAGLRRVHGDHAVGIGGVAAMLGVTLFTIGVALAAEHPLGILLIWPLGVTFSAVLGGIGGYAACRATRKARLARGAAGEGR